MPIPFAPGLNQILRIVYDSVTGALKVKVVSGGGGGGGGGTEYTEGATDDPATGPAVLIRETGGALEVPSDTFPMPSKVLSSALPTGASTALKQDTGNTSLSNIDSKVLTNTQLRATPVPVSGPLTDTELRATPVPVSGPLTDTQLRASAVPVSAASLPLPSGAATSVNQSIEITALQAIQSLLSNQFISGEVESPSVKAYTLDQSSIEARTLNTLNIQTDSGTATVTVKIDGVAVTGLSALSVSSTPGSFTATALNGVSIGQKVTLEVTAMSAPTNMAFTLKYTRVL